MNLEKCTDYIYFLFLKPFLYFSFVKNCHVFSFAYLSINSSKLPQAFWYPCRPHEASQVTLMIKNPPANAGDIRDTGSVPGLGRSPGEGHGNPLQYSCLENPMDRGACGLQSMLLQRIRHDWVTNTSKIKGQYKN